MSAEGLWGCIISFGTTAVAIFGSSVWLGFLLLKKMSGKSYKELPKVTESDERTVSHLPVLEAPVLTGYKLGFTSWSVKNIPFFRSLIAYTVKKNLQIEGFLKRRLREQITHFPLEKFPEGSEPAPEFDHTFDLSWLEKLADQEPYVHDRATCLQFYKAYKSGAVTPSKVAEKVIERIAELKSNKLNLNIVTQYNAEDIRKRKLADQEPYEHDRATCLQFYKAYKSGAVTPSKVAEKVIERIAELKSNKLNLNIVTQYNAEDIRKQAAESTERYRKGETLSVLDGTPMAVKDFLKVDGFALTFGMPNKGYSESEMKAEEDSAVLRMRKAGVIIICITSAHEGGMGATGAAINRVNIHVRSAMNVSYCAGGSSGGSGAAVASGLCPLALGTDGGGSIRIPASFNGVIGVKATFARVSSDLSRSPLVHTGPMCWTVADSLAAYHYISGPSLRFIPCFNSFTPPKIKLREGFEHHFVEGSLPEGFKVGIDAEYVKQAFDPQVSECVLGMAEKLKAKGAEIVPISIPEIFESFRAFVVLFGSEGIYHLTYGEFKEFEDEYSSSLILLHTMSSKLKSAYYHLAGQQKTRMIYFIREILQKVDVMLFPGTGMKTPFINPSDLKYGCVNLSRETEIARYTWLGNLTGMPAVSIPVCWFQMTNKPDQIADQKDKLTKDTYVGQTDDKDIPCSIQVCGRWWREDDCFLTARAIESIRDAEMEKRDKVKFQLNYTVSP